MIFSAPQLRGFCFFITFYGNIKAQKKTANDFFSPAIAGLFGK
jgi:hypothetical protein